MVVACVIVCAVPLTDCARALLMFLGAALIACELASIPHVVHTPSRGSTVPQVAGDNTYHHAHCIGTSMFPSMLQR